MNELARVHYLEAMGISSYAPRFLLPAAKPSVVCEMPLPVSLPDAKSATDTLTNTQTIRQTEPSASTPIVAGNSRLTDITEPSAATAGQTADRAQPSSQAYVAFALMVVVADNGVMVVADIPRGRQGPIWFDNGRQFIVELLQAIDSGSQVTFSDVFKWPLNRQLQGGEAEVHQALTGIFNRIGLTAEQPIIALGKQARYFMPKLMANDSASIANGHALPSLFANASHKAQLWKNLQPLVNRSAK
jgi:hypothetical protein